MSLESVQTPSSYKDAVAILGVPFDCVSASQAINRMEAMIASGKPHFVVTANVDFLVQSRSDIELRRILIAADVVLCDGTPVLWASRLLGNPLPERVAGSDIVPTLLQLAEQKSYKVFILGGTPESASTAEQKVRKKLPNIQLQSYAPPFNRLLEMDHDEIRRRIREAKPDLLLVSFGCPKQEKWIYMHYRDLGVPVSIGVGGTVDFLAEHLKRAPVWMRKSGTEWVYRLLQEPKRLAGRYSKDLWVFGNSFLRQLYLSKTPSRKNPAATATGFITENGYRYRKLPQNFDRAFLQSNGLFQDHGDDVCAGWIIDATQVCHIDSTAVACLTRWNAFLRSKGICVLLAGATLPVCRSLQFAGVWDLFETTPDLDSAQHWMRRKQQEETTAVRHQTTPSGFTVFWHGDVTAATAPAIWSATSAIVAQRSPGQGSKVSLDLSSVPFMDSTGLGTVIRLRKALLQTGAELTLSDVQPAVANVIRISQLENLLLSRKRKGFVSLPSSTFPPLGTPAGASKA